MFVKSDKLFKDGNTDRCKIGGGVRKSSDVISNEVKVFLTINTALKMI